MSSLRYDTRILKPIPQAGPGRIPLRRRVSAPELADLGAIYGNTEEPYKVGNSIRIQLQGSAESQPSRTVTAKIVKTFTPFSMAPVMVVRIFEPTMDLRGDLVLKIYDNRCSDELCQQYKVERWSRERDMKLEKRRWLKHLVRFFYKIMADDFLYAEEDEDKDEVSDDGEMTEDTKRDEEDASNELVLPGHLPENVSSGTGSLSTSSTTWH